MSIVYRTKLHAIGNQLRRMLDGETQMSRDIRRLMKTDELPRNLVTEIYNALH